MRPSTPSDREHKEFRAVAEIGAFRLSLDDKMPIAIIQAPIPSIAYDFARESFLAATVRGYERGMSIDMEPLRILRRG